MPELLIAPTSAPNIAPKPPSEAPSNPVKQANASAESQASPHGPKKAPQESSSAQASFASVLKKQMAQSQAANGAKAADAADPITLAANPALDLTASEASSLAPFIEQLIPQLTKKSATEDDATHPAENSLNAPVDLTEQITVASVAITPHVVSESNPATQDLPETGDGLSAQAGPLAGRPGQTATDLMSAAAISADDAIADSALASAAKPSGDFAALVSHATEQLAASSHISPAANPRHMAVGDAAMHMEHPVGHADWSNELGNKLNWMATAQRQQADLVLNPPQLGRVEISLTVTGDQATAVFASASAEVRELLEDSLPRLREILSGAGINLGEAEVGAESSNRFGTQDQPGDNGTGVRGRVLPGDDMGMIAIPSASMTGGRGMVDIFA